MSDPVTASPPPPPPTAVVPQTSYPAPVPVASASVAPGWYNDPRFNRDRWWDGSQWTEHFAPAAAPQLVVMPQKKQTNHVLHLLLSVFTFGLWIPVWIIIAIANA